MPGEWITKCEDCPMQESGACRAVPAGSARRKYLGDGSEEWTDQYQPSAVGGCAEPLRMAIAAGLRSVEELTRAMDASKKDAAPDLYEALRVLVDIFPSRPGLPGPDHYVDNAALENARAALAKARNE